jgi:GntR family transcriptional repressor for pyruvate dehydrogenase complex
MSGRLQRPSLTSLAADAVLQLIRDRGLKEGDPLPSAGELAETLGVSRTVVRESLAELAGQGLVKNQQGSASVVALPGSSQLERIVRMRFAVQGGSLETVQELRESIEVAAASLAAERATQSDIEALNVRLSELRAARTVEDLHEADRAFHRAVVDASGNDLMAVTIDAMTPLLDQLLLRVWDGWLKSGRGATELVEAHAVILDRIGAGDGEGAARAMRENLRQGRIGFALSRN